jgi:drug/metabolite transporter (DMT)-like permease
MNKNALGADLLLLLTAAIWGLGFVAQRSGMEYIGPFGFNGVRFILGSIALLPVILWQRSRRKNRAQSDKTSIEKPDLTSYKKILLNILAAGSICFIAVTLQQIGIIFTTAGNAGFITGLYVVLTPVFGIFLGRKTGYATWAGGVFTLIGLYFVSAMGSAASASGAFPTVNPGDLIIAISAIFWAFHVLVIDRLVKKTDPLVLSSGQFLFCGLFSLIAAFLAEPVLAQWVRNINMNIAASELVTRPIGLIAWTPFPALITGLSSGTIPFELVRGAIIPILFGGLVSVGIAYTLQVVAQRHAPPAHATIILCLEGCFAALGGILILNEPLGSRTVLGFALMLTGMLVSQWAVIYKAGKNGLRTNTN